MSLSAKNSNSPDKALPSIPEKSFLRNIPTLPRPLRTSGRSKPFEDRNLESLENERFKLEINRLREQVISKDAQIGKLCGQLGTISKQLSLYEKFPERALESIERIDDTITQAVKLEIEKCEIVLDSIYRIERVAVEVVENEKDRHECALSRIKDAENGTNEHENDESDEQINLMLDNPLQF